ncbi:MAG: glycosyltransferase [Candidatus Lokiarchaeia archaeon]
MATFEIRDYEPIIGSNEVEVILSLAERVNGARITHVNATAYGGGVAEILKSHIPLARSVGLDAKWLVLSGNKEFFNVTKSIHNALQGNTSIKLDRDMREIYLKTNEQNSKTLEIDGLDSSDIVIIHDPQPLPLVENKMNGGWVWRCHIDNSQPSRQVWDFLKPFIKKYDALIFTHEAYIPTDFNNTKTFVRQPCIDPLSDKNKPLTPTEILNVLEKFGLDPDRPIIGQVSRFDPWKNPIGVIDAFLRVKEQVPDVQLVLIGSFAYDDPECSDWCERTFKKAEISNDIHVLTNLEDVEVNAIQRALSVAFQLSVKEGFGLTVTEALWKGVPVVATRVGGIPLQVIDGVTGLLVDDVEEAAEKAILLLRNRWLARRLEQKGIKHIKRNFLVTKHLKDYLSLYIELVGA